jgi:hypothetical protein
MIDYSFEDNTNATKTINSMIDRKICYTGLIVVRPGESEVTLHNFGSRMHFVGGDKRNYAYWKVEEDVFTCPKKLPTGFIAPEDTSNSSNEHQSSSDDMSFLQ